MKVLSVVGARPQFIKLSPVDTALRQAGHEHIIVHTGQHYAPELSDSLFQDLAIPEPDVNLDVRSGSHARQTATMMTGLEEVFAHVRPDWVLVYGDTNSTLAASITAVKMHLLLAHLEAGLRSGNRAMPEEHNRVVTDHVSDLLLAPTETAMRHLADEGLAFRSVKVGDVMADVCYQVRDRTTLNPPSMPQGWLDSADVILTTLHRAENTDDPKRLDYLLTKLGELTSPVVLVAHPRLIAKVQEHGIRLDRGQITTISSMTYSQMVYAVGQARGVITDSGGLQKEAFLLDTPCITARTETEWPETLADGWNIIDPQLTHDAQLQFSRSREPRRTHPFGLGDAAQLVVRELSNVERAKFLCRVNLGQGYPSTQVDQTPPRS